jgi:hypothetical protein
MPPLDPLPDGETLDLATFELPAGSYLIDAPIRFHSQQINDGEASVSCDLMAGGEQLDIYQLQFREEEDYQFKVAPLLGTTELAGPANVVIRCRANYWPGSPFAPSIIGVFDGPIVATRVGSVTYVEAYGT